MSVRRRAVDGVLEHPVGAAIGAADQAHLLQIVLSLEHVALFGLPHAVIRPGHRMVGIRRQRPLVPELSVIVAAELTAGIADQRRHVGVVVIAQRQQRGDTRFIVALVVDQRVGGVIAGEEIFRRTALVFLVLCGGAFV